MMIRILGFKVPADHQRLMYKPENIMDGLEGLSVSPTRVRDKSDSKEESFHGIFRPNDGCSSSSISDRHRTQSTPG